MTVRPYFTSFYIILSLCGMVASQQNINNLLVGGKFATISGTIDPSILSEDWNTIWEETKLVPETIPAYPKEKLMISYSGALVRPNKTFTGDKLIQLPQVQWKADQKSLYTFLIAHLDIYHPPGQPEVHAIHAMVTNIPGDSIAKGTENHGYIPPFVFAIGPNMGLVEDPSVSHRFAYLVFKQQGRIDLPAEKEICGKNFGKRDQNIKEIIKTNNLGNPVAGNFIRVVYGTGETAKSFICLLSRCSESSFPFPIPGVNDRPECKRK